MVELQMLTGDAGDREAGEVGRGVIGVHHRAVLGQEPVAAVVVVRPGDEAAGAALLDGLPVGMLGDLHVALLHQHLHGGVEPLVLPVLAQQIQAQLHVLLAGLGELGGGDLHVLLAQLGDGVLLAVLLPVHMAGDGQAGGLEGLADLIDGLLGLGRHEDVRVILGGRVAGLVDRDGDGGVEILVGAALAGQIHPQLHLLLAGLGEGGGGVSKRAQADVGGERILPVAVVHIALDLEARGVEGLSDLIDHLVGVVGNVDALVPGGGQSERRRGEGQHHQHQQSQADPSFDAESIGLHTSVPPLLVSVCQSNDSRYLYTYSIPFVRIQRKRRSEKKKPCGFFKERLFPPVPYGG